MMQKTYLPLEVRAADDAPDGVVEAYGSVFDTEYAVLGGREVIRPGAFEDSLAERDSIAIYHQHGHKFGRPPIGFTTKAREDDTGLRFRAQLLIEESETARVVFRGIENRALTEWSIGFRAIETREDPDEPDLVEVLEADVPEISSVLVGANPETDTIDARQAVDLSELRDRANELGYRLERIEEDDDEDDDEREDKVDLDRVYDLLARGVDPRELGV